MLKELFFCEHHDWSVPEQSLITNGLLHGFAWRISAAEINLLNCSVYYENIWFKMHDVVANRHNERQRKANIESGRTQSE